MTTQPHADVAKIATACLRGVDGLPITVSAAVVHGLDMIEIAGLAEAAHRELRVRVQSAIRNSAFPWPTGRINVALATHGYTPRLDGTGFDLPVALSLLLRGDHADPQGHATAAIGELSLAGEVRPVRGIAPMVLALRLGGVRDFVVAVDNAEEALVALNAAEADGNLSGGAVYAVRNLREAVMVASGDSGMPSRYEAVPRAPRPTHVLDFADVKGNVDAVREIEDAAVKQEAILLLGPPGAGKTMLARRAVGILPDMSWLEALDVTCIQSAAGLNIGGGLVKDRPFRAPHHSTTAPGLVGGGTASPRPGEATLAHHGVLFLDGLTEFSRTAIDMLREPIATGEVRLMRAAGTVTFPARPWIIATASPCPCGYHGSPTSARKCRCAPADVTRYMERVKAYATALGIKRFVKCEPVDLDAVERGEVSPNNSTAEIKARVAKRIEAEKADLAEQLVDAAKAKAKGGAA